MTNLQRLAEVFAEYEDAEDARKCDSCHCSEKVNEAYTNLMKIPGSRHLNFKESHPGFRLWFDYGVMCTRFFWKDGVLQPKNDSWTSAFGPFYYAMIDKKTGERRINDRIRETRTWEEYAADAQESIKVLFEEEK